MEYKELATSQMHSIAKIFSVPLFKRVQVFSGGEAFVMTYLYQAGQALPSEISKAMQVSTARMAAVLGSLEKKKWIKREIDKENRRQIIVSLTQEGKQFIKSKTDAAVDGLAMMLQELGEEDATELVRISERVAELANKRRQKA